MKNLLWLLAFVGLTISLQAQDWRTIPGHVPPAVKQLQLKPLSRLPDTNQLRLVVGLPFHNQNQLQQLLTDLNDPASTNYHQWLSPDEFSRRFGPTEEDYRKVLDFVEGSGLKVTGLWSNRMLVDVEAPATKIENAFRVTLRLYPHPKENRNFYAPDTDPSVPINVPILHISGLDNFTLPHPLAPVKPVSLATNTASPRTTPAPRRAAISWARIFAPLTFLG